MLDINKLVLDAGLLTAAFVVIVLLIARFKPRVFLTKDDVPADILAAVPPRSKAEEREAKILMVPIFVILIGGAFYSTFTLFQQTGAGFLPLFLHALGIILTISIVDLVLIDWLVLNTWTPKWVVFPGTDGFAGYKDYGFHLRAHLKALPSQVIGSAVAAGLVLLVGALF